jgi:hypothetical protein
VADKPSEQREYKAWHRPRITSHAQFLVLLLTYISSQYTYIHVVDVA